MKNKISLTLSLTCCLLLGLLQSCKKDINAPGAKAPQKLSAQNANGPIPPLDWENIELMPVPAGEPAIYVPWANGAGGAKMDDDMIFDYRSADGWALVYNTFSTTATAGPKYFMLYNRYRGVLRIYVYTTASNPPTDNIVHLLKFSGSATSASPMLNYAAQEVVDMDVNSQSAAQLQDYKVSASGSWYAADFELAYDPQAVNQDHQQFRLNWQINPNSISSIQLNGNLGGNIGGTIETPQTNTNFFAGLIGSFIGSVKVTDVLQLLAPSDPAKKPKYLSNPNLLSVMDAAQNASSGVVKGFLNGIFGSTTTMTTQKVSLKINTTIQLQGTATTSSQLYDNIFSAPGTQGIQNAIPFYPSLSEPLGLFYLANKPVLIRQSQVTPIEDEWHMFNVVQSYTVDPNSINLQFNPALAATGATISNLKTEVVIQDLDQDDLDFQQVQGYQEQVGDRTVYTGQLTRLIYKFRDQRFRKKVDNLAVRISFDVNAPNGKKTTVVKTFKAANITNGYGEMWSF